ncbi:hypothetical protein [Desulfitobacterium hafniense]|uniref:hypothetical protein n=1 Tax=Desulfitobacterium hafniense TaxID=49338 RepID=UPI000375018E|nr:hypothetical protein [Desulfitobacterium hafniense]
MKQYLLTGNGINIQHGGYDCCNAAIILRALKCFKDPNFPKHIITDDPIEAKCYIGYLFLEISRIIRGGYDRHANSTTERESLEEFKNKYKDKRTFKITDVGFEDYYLIHDLLCHRIGIVNPERYVVREAMRCCFLNAIYDNGKVNALSNKYSPEFIAWLHDFDVIFTTNYDTNIEMAAGVPVLHLHGDFVTRRAVYNPDSFRNMLSDHPYADSVIDEDYAHLYSTALTTYSGDYKQYSMQEGELANAAVEKMAIAYKENLAVHDDIDSWENDRNILVARMRESIILKCENPDLRFAEPYPIQPLRDIDGELFILGLSPYNDRHLFKIINESKVKQCTFYFYNEAEQDIIKALLPNIDVHFEDVRKFWESKNKANLKAKAKTSKGKRINFKDITRAGFHDFAECHRALSGSIMSDADMVRQFNAIPYHARTQICRRIKELEVERSRVPDQQFVLSIVDVHILAEEFNIDPAVVCCVGVDRGRNEFIRLR